MFKEYLETYKLVIVIVGNFNPSIIQPFWLANKKLIRENEAQNAEVNVVHNEITQFNIGWAHFEITSQKFQISTSQEPYFEPIRDLVIEIFNILKETPIKHFGINHMRYFDLRDKERYYNFGNKLAPLNNWNEFLNDPRLFSLTITERNRKDGLKGEYNISVQPPDIKIASQFGLLININDHLNCEDQSFLKIFSDNWEPSFKKADNTLESFWNKINY